MIRHAAQVSVVVTVLAHTRECVPDGRRSAGFPLRCGSVNRVISECRLNRSTVHVGRRGMCSHAKNIAPAERNVRVQLIRSSRDTPSVYC